MSEPLTLTQLLRLNDCDRLQLRARVKSKMVAVHPEMRAVVLALLDHIEQGRASQDTMRAHAAWTAYYTLSPEE